MRRATVIDGVGAQLVVPGFVVVDLAQPVPGAVFGQPRGGIGGPDVDRVPDTCADVSGVATHRAASCSEPYFETPRGGAVPGTRGTPAAVDVELDAVVGGIRCRPAQGTEESRIKVGDAGTCRRRRRAVGDGTVGTSRTASATGSRRLRRSRQRRRAGRRRGSWAPTGRGRAGARRSCRQSRQRGVAGPSVVFDMPAICASSLPSGHACADR